MEKQKNYEREGTQLNTIKKRCNRRSTVKMEVTIEVVRWYAENNATKCQLQT